MPLGTAHGAGGAARVRDALAGYTLARAASHEAAAATVEGHPHSTLFPGEAVEVVDGLHIPGM